MSIRITRCCGRPPVIPLLGRALGKTGPIYDNARLWQAPARIPNQLVFIPACTQRFRPWHAQWMFGAQGLLAPEASTPIPSHEKDALVADTSSITRGESLESQPATRQLVHDAIVHWLREEAEMDIHQIEDDALLFELGIDSMGAAAIGGQLESLTGKTLNPEVLYELETISELTTYLDSLSVAPVASSQRPLAEGTTPGDTIENATGAGGEDVAQPDPWRGTSS